MSKSKSIDDLLDEILECGRIKEKEGMKKEEDGEEKEERKEEEDDEMKKEKGMKNDEENGKERKKEEETEMKRKEEKEMKKEEEEDNKKGKEGKEGKQEEECPKREEEEGKKDETKDKQQAAETKNTMANARNDDKKAAKDEEEEEEGHSVDFQDTRQWVVGQAVPEGSEQPIEAQRVLKVVEELLHDDGARAEDIGVGTVYESQAMLIRRLLAESKVIGANRVFVGITDDWKDRGPVDDFVFSLAASADKNTVSSLSEHPLYPHLLLAISRPKQVLHFIGNSAAIGSRQQTLREWLESTARKQPEPAPRRRPQPSNPPPQRPPRRRRRRADNSKNSVNTPNPGPSNRRQMPSVPSRSINPRPSNGMGLATTSVSSSKSREAREEETQRLLEAYERRELAMIEENRRLQDKLAMSKNNEYLVEQRHFAMEEELRAVTVQLQQSLKNRATEAHTRFALEDELWEKLEQSEKACEEMRLKLSYETKVSHVYLEQFEKCREQLIQSLGGGGPSEVRRNN